MTSIGVFEDDASIGVFEDGAKGKKRTLKDVNERDVVESPNLRRV